MVRPHPAPAQSDVVLRLPHPEARALDAMFVQLGGLEREIAHARETAARRGDEASEERVLDLESEHHCQAERITTTVTRILGKRVHEALAGAAR